MKYVIVFDFDKTITINDVVVDILDKFNVFGWREIEQKVGLGELSLRECLNWEINEISINKSEYLNAISELIQLDTGAIDLFSFIRENNIPVFVISDSLLTAIKFVFEVLNLGDGIQYTLDAHEIIWDGEKRIGIKLANEPCDHGCANCKISKIRKIKTQYPDHKIAFVGDGYTDILAAPEADIIFARSDHFLTDYLKNKEISHHIYNDLKEVKDILVNSE